MPLTDVLIALNIVGSLATVIALAIVFRQQQIDRQTTIQNLKKLTEAVIAMTDVMQSTHPGAKPKPAVWETVQ